MAWGISPKSKIAVPLSNFGRERYLAIVFKALENLNWKVSYVDDNGIIAYTPISWQSYSEEITVNVINGVAHIKSECVGYQNFFYDYGKNEKNIELFVAEIEYAAYHFKADEEMNMQRFKANYYQHPGISMAYTPIGAKALLTHLGTIFIPRKNYQVTPWLIIINCFIFLFKFILLLALNITYREYGYNDKLGEIFTFLVSDLGGIERKVVLGGDYWRLLTACFQHGSFSHLFFNMVFLAYIGSIIEGRVGKWNFLGLYLMTGICASIASIAYRYEGTGIGASGAILGMFGVFLAYLSTPFFERKARTAFLISTLIICAIVLYPSGKGIDHAAHFGGFFSGYIFGLFSYLAYSNEEKLKRYGIRLASYLVIFALAISTLLFIPNYDLKTYRETKDQIYENLNIISNYFYGSRYRYMEKDLKLPILQSEMRPYIPQTEDLLKKVKSMAAPEEERKANEIDFAFYSKKLEIYKLLLKEYETGDKKYRVKIEKIWAEIEELKKSVKE